MIVDSNILLHLFNPDDDASKAVAQRFARIAANSQLRINHIIFAEISPAFPDADAVAAVVASLKIKLVGLTKEDAFRAGEAFRAYRRNGGSRTTILPDFLIASQASNRGWSILTRDSKHFSTYFPEVELIDPMQAQA